MSDLRLEVYRIENGTLIRVTRDDDETEYTFVVQEFEEELQALEAWRQCFAFILDEFGPSKGRYSNARLYLTVAPGDKHEAFDDTLFYTYQPQ